jgi:general stress protein YciG
LTEKKKLRGFAAIKAADPKRQLALARKGGANVPREKRSFSQNRDKAAAAGRVGGARVPKEKRTFSTNKDLAMRAGRKGGQTSRRNRPEKGAAAPLTAPAETK